MRTTRPTRFEPRQAVCPECGTCYTQDEPWKTMCWPCYRDAHPERYGPAARRALPGTPTPQVEALQREITLLQSQLRTAKTLIAMLQSQLETRMTSSAAPFDADMLGKLIRLCHPDRHANSPVANEVTTWLLKLRKGRR